MKIVIAIVIVALLGVGGFKLWEYWDQTDQRKSVPDPTAGVRAESLPGLPSTLEPKLQEAMAKKNPEALKEFIDSIKKSPLVKDPRLAWIELDYVVMVATKDPSEARKVFLKVKERTPTDSPVYPRVKSLEGNFQ
jgi:hypothetical protein